MKRSQNGLGAIAAILVLVALAGLSAAIISLATSQSMTSAQDVLSSRAWQVASDGIEGGLYRALQKATCDKKNWSSIDYPRFKVTVECVSADYNEGEISPGTRRVLRVFRITATACNGTADDCPDNAVAAGVGYVERQKVAVAYCEWDGTACAGP